MFPVRFPYTYYQKHSAYYLKKKRGWQDLHVLFAGPMLRQPYLCCQYHYDLDYQCLRIRYYDVYCDAPTRHLIDRPNHNLRVFRN